jgi:hypothetical protein
MNRILFILVISGSAFALQMPLMDNTLAPAGLSSTWDQALSQIELTIKDVSLNETGYTVLRARNFGPFTEIASLTSAVPTDTSSILLLDTVPSLNSWYTYRVIVYNDTKKDSSETIAYAFPAQPKKAAKRLVLQKKILTLPLRFGSWAMRCGDTIFMNEPTMPAEQILKLTFVYLAKDSMLAVGQAVAASSPLLRDTAASFYSHNNAVFACKDDSVRYFTCVNGSVVQAGRPRLVLKRDAGQVPVSCRGIGCVNGNVLIMRAEEQNAVTFGSYFFSDRVFCPLRAWTRDLATCTRMQFISFVNGVVNEELVTGRQNGQTCTFGAWSQRPNKAFDFSYDPRFPIATVLQSSANNGIRGFDGFESNEVVLRNARMVSVDSLGLRAYVFTAADLSVYRFNGGETEAGHAVRSGAYGSGPAIRFDQGTRRLLVTGPALRTGTVVAGLFSMNGRLLFAKTAEMGAGIRVPEGISGIIIAQVKGCGKTANVKIGVMGK